jgi:aminoglycoside phosphotransferase (APT) family kinase protein
MHADEIDTDPSLVHRLLASQFPHWSSLPIEPVPSAGTDNAIYRLGDDMAVRLPRIPATTTQVDKEQEWLPKLAPYLPLAIPTPLAKGSPGEGYPWHWSVYTWLEGENALSEPVSDLRQAALDLAGFISALQRIDPTGGPLPGPENFNRGEPLANRDANTRASIELLHGIIDTTAATAAWEADLHAPIWDRPPVWIHGDLSPLNLLVKHDRVSAVIDFGCLGVGDPACEYQVAWNFLSADSRDIFREALSIDDASWARGRGWALSCGLIALPYYRVTNPILAGVGRRAIAEVLADHQRRT